MKKLGLILSFCALTYVSGAHLALVQGIAWGRMLVDYSQASGLAAGISQTFDGEHPCASCNEVKKAAQEHLPRETVLKLSDLKAPTLPTTAMAPTRYASGVTANFRPDFFARGISAQAPPLPPPRA